MGDVRGQLGPLSQDGGVHIAHGEALLRQQRHHMGQHLQAVRPGVGGICVGEVSADISQARRPQEGVHDGVDKDVGVGVAQQALLPGDLRSA